MDQIKIEIDNLLDKEKKKEEDKRNNIILVLFCFVLFGVLIFAFVVIIDNAYCCY